MQTKRAQLLGLITPRRGESASGTSSYPPHVQDKQRMTARGRHYVIAGIGLLALMGCATKEPQVNTATQQLLQQKEQEVASLQAAQVELEQTLLQREMELQQQAQAVQEAQQAVEISRAKEASVQARADTPPDNQLLPPKAKAGECYTRVFIPATYKTETGQLLKREASERLVTIPAKYEWVEERVMIHAASERIEVVPATYGWVQERVLVKEASTRLEIVPPVYEDVSEQVLVKPAHTVWKKGTGPLQRVDHATGEIMCLVEVPAVNKTVTKRVMKTPATTRSVEIPAEYSTVRKRVVKTPATTRTVQLPAQFKTVRVRKLVAPPQTKRSVIPAQYQTVTRRTKVTDESMAWRPVLCQTNITPSVVTSIQQALHRAGHDPGPIDGMIGKQTRTAIEAFQQAKGLPRGGLTFDTLKALGVRS